MYIPEYFRINDKKEILSFIEKNSFGVLTSYDGQRPCSTHLPFLMNEEGTMLSTHLARQNSQLNYIENQEMLICLSGPHDYISPSWYEGKGVPTWNYQAVHIYGTCRMVSDPAALKNILSLLVNKYESAEAAPWQAEYPDSMLRGIVGIEIDITDIQCKYKLSQNRSAQDVRNVSDQLSERGSEQLASEMLRQLGSV